MLAIPCGIIKQWQVVEQYGKLYTITTSMELMWLCGKFDLTLDA